MADSPVLPVRVPRPMRERWEAAAAERGWSLGQFVRAAGEAFLGEPVPAPLVAGGARERKPRAEPVSLERVARAVEAKPSAAELAARISGVALGSDSGFAGRREVEPKWKGR